MKIIEVPPSDVNSIKVSLFEDDLRIDSRLIEVPFKSTGMMHYKFSCRIEGRVLTLSRTDKNVENVGWKRTLKFRVYNPNEEKVPDFKSKSYTYWGLVGETVPKDTVEGFVHPSVRTIRKLAFHECVQMRNCTMSDSVVRIEDGAFMGCERMKSIRLSRSLKYIGESSFSRCRMVDGFFLPVTLEQIGSRAFMCCKNIKILLLPEAIRVQHLGTEIVNGCNSLLSQINYQVGHAYFGGVGNNIEVNYWLKNYLDNLPLLKVCAQAPVTTQMIDTCIQLHGPEILNQKNDHGLTFLHILSINPHASLDTIQACLEVNPIALFSHDNYGMTPINYFWMHDNVEAIVVLIKTLCINSLELIT